MFFSIKNKIVTALILILLSVTGFNLIYSYIMFKSDKEAYIFENALRNGEIATDKILTFLKANSEKLASNQKTKDESFFLSGEYLNEGKKFLFYYNDESFKDLEEKIKQLVQSTILKNKNDVSAYPLSNQILIVIPQSNGLRFGLLNKTPITETLEKDNIFDYIVTNTKNQTFYGNKKLLSGFKTTVKGAKQGSTIAKANEKNWLISYTTIQKLNLMIFSYISEDQAFAIFKNIIYKNISFTVIILGFFLILSLIFSKKITTPIIQLIEKTKEIADGNMENEIFVNTNDELKELGSSVNVMSSKIKKLLDDKQDMIKQLEIANSKLDEYNKNLEGIVAERTKKLREANNFITAMINSLDQGLFVFDKTKKCLDIFTNACEKIFNKNPKGLEVPKLLSLNTKEIEAFEKWNNVIFSNLMPFEAAKNLGPKNVVTSSYGKNDFQFISLDYYPMVDEDEKLENVVVVATDKTTEVEAEERFKEKDAYVSMILNIIKNKKAFYDFLDEMEEMLTNLSNFDRHEDLSNIAMIAFHSMNGGFANYSISHLVKVARNSETQIKSFIGNRKELENLLKSLIANFRKERDQLLREIEVQLGNTKNKVEIEVKDLTAFKEGISKGENPNELFNNYFVNSRIENIFKPYADLIKQIGKKINKPMMPMLIIGGDIRVNTDKIKEFSSALVHLIRNCMDHGIESTDKRLQSGKPEEGSISITCEKIENDFLRIVVKDDGDGIRIDKIRSVLDKKEIDHSNLSDKEVMMYIFKPDFSTAEKLTELSGRGVGMSAIDQAIKNLGGRLDLESTPGKGSKFIFDLPI